jgi:16S rRNA (guanine527-N7)-methyltransferase
MRAALESGLQAWGLQLDTVQWARLVRLTELMLEWNERMNLTSITDPLRIATEHYLDSLAPLRWGLIGHGITVADVGTGAGLPGLPLAICCPQAAFTLIEATQKKVVYLRDVVAQLGLTNVEVVAGRSEAIAHDRRYREGFDVAVARALGRLDVVWECTLPLVRVGGCAIAYKGPRGEQELTFGERAATVLGGQMEAVYRFTLPGTDLRRMLIVARKVAPTPLRFPRRPGIPEKHPLGTLTKAP